MSFEVYVIRKLFVTLVTMVLHCATSVLLLDHIRIPVRRNSTGFVAVFSWIVLLRRFRWQNLWVMVLHVLAEVTLLAKGSRADRTGVRLNTKVLEHVHIKMTADVKPLLAERTTEQPFAVVAAPMSLQP